MPTNASCPRCGAQFQCGASETNEKCWCTEQTLTNEQRATLAQAYDTCLCAACLEEIAEGGNVSPLSSRETLLMERLIAIMRRLRRECPWDREQTIESLRQYTIEETHELADAIVDDNPPEIRKELGDILMHIVFYSLIAEEEKLFTLADVIAGVNEKLIYRHPHVFGENRVGNARQVEQQWEALKLKERDGNRRVLQGVPRSLPSLTKAMRIQEKASAVGFDWENREQVWAKVLEEYGEVQEAIREKSQQERENEFGDLIFAVVNAARLYGVEPSLALERTNQRFISRFNYLESKTLAKGRSLHDMTLEEMDVYWEEAKQLERKAQQE